MLAGHFSGFDTWYRVDSLREGEFMERTAPGFVRDTIPSDRPRMRVLFDHGFDAQIGKKVLGMITDLRNDGTGAYFEVDLLDISYNRDRVSGVGSRRPHELPPVDALWSLAAYHEQTSTSSPNPANRYSVGDHDADMTTDEDGGLTLYLQESPAPGQEANWLPTSGAHPWFLILRLYRPQSSVVDVHRDVQRSPV